MRILFIIPEEFEGTRWGGVTSYTVELAGELRRLGHAVAVLTPGKQMRHVTRLRVDFYKEPYGDPASYAARIIGRLLHRLSPEIYHRLMWAAAVVRFVKTMGPFDVVEAPEWGSSTLFLALCRLQPIVIRLHKSWMMYKRDNALPLTPVDWITDMFERMCILTASLVTSPTRFMSMQYRWIQTIKNMRGRKIEIVPYGITMPSRLASRRKFTFAPYILTAGRIEVSKGSHLLALAFGRIVEEYPHYHLVFVGEDTTMFLDGAWTSCVDYMKKRLPLNARRNVIFVPRKSRKELMRYYQQCVFYVAPSRGHENPSIALLEAMANGKAVIGSNIGGIPEVIRHGKNGLVFRQGDVDDLEDKIVRLIHNGSLRRRLALRAQRDSRNKYDVRVTARNTLDLYRKL